MEKWGRCCAYCNKKDAPLEIDRIVARSKGGSDRVSNLTLSCHACNQKKGSQSLADFLKDPKKQAKIFSGARKPLKNAVAINSIRFEIGNRLKSLSLPIEFSTGGKTKFNRIQNNFPKDHWIDAACVGEAVGRGSRQMCLSDKFGFPRTKAKSQKVVRGFKTGDFVKAIVPKGQNQGTYFGTLAVRSNGRFCLKTPNVKVDGISAKHCVLMQQSLGYTFSFKKSKPALPLPAKGRGIRALEVL
ncbi:MAG: HNH endonuclease [Chlamydiota bacterium]